MTDKRGRTMAEAWEIAHVEIAQLRSELDAADSQLGAMGKQLANLGRELERKDAALRKFALQQQRLSNITDGTRAMFREAAAEAHRDLVTALLSAGTCHER